MKRYFIEEVKCDWNGGVGPCCGVGVVVVSIKYREDDIVSYLTLQEVEDEVSFFHTDEEIFDKLMNFSEYDVDSEEFAEVECLLEEEYLDEFDDVSLDSGDDELEDYFAELDDGENMTAKFLRYALCVLECPSEKLKEVIALGNGKYIDDVEYDYDELTTAPELKFLMQGSRSKKIEGDNGDILMAEMLINLNTYTDPNAKDEYLFATIIKENESYKFLILNKSMLYDCDYEVPAEVEPATLEEYSSLEEAEASKYYRPFEILMNSEFN